MSLSTDMNTMHGSVRSSKAGELTELGGGRFLLQRLFRWPPRMEGEDEMGAEGSGIKAEKQV